MKTLIVLSKQFPFGNKEQYIAHELKYLSEKFDRIIIYPHDHFQVNDSLGFQLPSNCEVVDLNTHVKRIGRAWPSLVFLYLFVREFFQVKRKIWWIKEVRKHYAIWLTQWSLAKGLEDYMHASDLKASEIVFYSYWFSASAVCLSILRMRKKIDGFVSRAHALDLYHEEWKSPDPDIVSLPFRFFKQRQVKLVFPISNHGMDFLRQTMPANKLERRYLGVFDFGLNPDTSASQEFVVVSCSGVDERKRIHLIGEALSIINRPVRWIHFGDGPLKQLAIDSVTSKNVVLDYRGQVPNAEIRKFYANCHADVFINVSMSEGLPVAIMESMSHGVPAIGVRDYGTSEIVLDNYTGKLLPPSFTTADLVQAIVFLMETSRMSEFRANARKHYQANFNAENNYREFANRLTAC